MAIKAEACVHVHTDNPDGALSKGEGDKKAGRKSLPILPKGYPKDSSDRGVARHDPAVLWRFLRRSGDELDTKPAALRRETGQASAAD